MIKMSRWDEPVEDLGCLVDTPDTAASAHESSSPHGPRATDMSKDCSINEQFELNEFRVLKSHLPNPSSLA